MSPKTIWQQISNKKEHSLASASLTLIIAFGLSSLLGFLRSRFLYSHFYSCCASQLDVYNAAFRLPDLIFRLLVSGALTSSFIPVFSQLLHQDKKQANQLASSVMSLLLLVFSIFSLFIYIFAYPLTKAITPGFTPDQLQLLVPLTRILLFAQICFLVSNFLTGYLQTFQVFLIPSVSPILYNLAIIASIFFLAPVMGIQGVVFGAVLGSILHLAVQIPPARKLGFSFKWNPDWHAPGVSKVIQLMLPRSLSLGLSEVESTLVLFWASTFKPGSLSLLNLALQVVYLPSRIFGATIGQASLPMLSNNVARNQLDKFQQLITSTILKTAFLASPIALICLVNRVAIVRLAFGTRSFPWAATLDTAEALAFLTPTIFAQAIIQILSRAFYALHNTRTPLYIAVVSLITTIITSTWFSQSTSLGITGLAISITLGSLVQLFGLLFALISLLSHFNWKHILLSGLKMIAVSILMAICMWATMRALDVYILDTTKTINVAWVFVGSSTFGLATYFLLGWALNISECRWLINLIAKKLSKYDT